VIKASDLAENSPTRGCMTIKPYGFALWDNIKNALDAEIKAVGVQNCYFPLLIPLSFLAKEADHIDGFATECAIVTHHRLEKNEDGKLVPAPSSELTEPLIVRPTSETIIGESVKNWIQSYRDLPMKLNQWCNVFRWEMRTRLFLRTAEFLWQEGHNVFETADEARADMEKMLECYADILENWMATPVIRGYKTEDERFPGAVDTMTVETMMQDGKALQSGTSHFLGQTFSKSADITFQSREGDVKHAWTTSWGFSTRVIGGLIMAHGDDDGYSAIFKR
jgi:prolyl-tRNA synthetase